MRLPGRLRACQSTAVLNAADWTKNGHAGTIHLGDLLAFTDMRPGHHYQADTAGVRVRVCDVHSVHPQPLLEGAIQMKMGSGSWGQQIITLSCLPNA